MPPVNAFTAPLQALSTDLQHLRDMHDASQITTRQLRDQAVKLCQKLIEKFSSPIANQQLDDADGRSHQKKLENWQRRTSGRRSPSNG